MILQIGQQMNLLIILRIFSSIEDYLRYAKKKQYLSEARDLFKVYLYKDNFFNEDIHPEDMDFDINLLVIDFKMVYLSNYYKIY